MPISYQKLLKKFKEKNITSYTIKKEKIIHCLWHLQYFAAEYSSE